MTSSWEERRTLLLVNLASVVDSADESLLPAVYKEVGAALHATPVGLGSLTLARSAVQALCYPLAAYMASRYNRVFVITLGAFLWATATFLVAHHPRNVAVAQREFLRETKATIQIPTFQIFIAQGVPGSFAGSAFSFLPMWFELIGFSHKDTALLLTILSISYAIGGLFAGVLGDFAAKRLPNAGRIILSQISSGSKIPLAGILLLGLPYDASLVALYSVIIFFMGFITCWEDAATNNPIFAEIVPEKSRTSIYAFDRSLETMLASFAPTFVGLLAEKIYNYKIEDGMRSDDPKINQANAVSLAKALYTAVAIPMAICCSIYSFLYCTYPRDRDRAKMYSRIACETQDMELATSQVVANYSPLQNLEPDE